MSWKQFVLIGNNKLTCKDYKSRNFSVQLNGLMTKDYMQQGMDTRVKNVGPTPKYLELFKSPKT